MRATALIFSFVLGAFAAPSAVILDLYQAGADVVLSGGGALALGGQAPAGSTNLGPAIGDWFVVSGPPAAGALVWQIAVAGPATIATGLNLNASSGAGVPFGFVFTPGAALIGFKGYTLGDNFSTSATFQGTTLAAIGIAPGSYVWFAGPQEESITLNVGQGNSGVPEPASALLFGAGAAWVFWRRAR